MLGGELAVVVAGRGWRIRRAARRVARRCAHPAAVFVRRTPLHRTATRAINLPPHRRRRVCVVRSFRVRLRPCVRARTERADGHGRARARACAPHISVSYTGERNDGE